RLKGLVLRLPPLRERRADVPLLAARFIREAAAEVGRPALPLSDAALAALERNDWPGNARELQNCLRQALALAAGNAITVGEPALARTVELKLREYSEHLLRVVEGFGSLDEAIAACRRRFKNLPERHFRSLELLVRQHFDRRSSTARV